MGGLAGSPGEGSVAGQRWAVELGRGKTGQPLYDKPPAEARQMAGGSLRLSGIPRLENNLDVSGLPGCGGWPWEVRMAPELASEKVMGFALAHLGMDYKVKHERQWCPTMC